MNKAIPFLFYYLVLSAVVSFSPYLVLHYELLNFTGAQIGLLVGIPPLLTTFTLPLLTGIADATNRHRLLLSGALLFMVTATLLLLVLETFGLILLLITFAINVFAVINPLANSATMVMLGNQQELYGRVRLGGTLGYSVTSAVMGGLVQNYTLRIAFISAAMFFFLAFLVSQKLTHHDGLTTNHADWSQVGQLFSNPYILTFLVIGFSGGLTFAAVNNYLFPYMKSLGATEMMMGFALTAGTIAEIPVMIFVNRFIKQYRAYTLAVFAVFMTAVRFLIFAIAPNAMVVLAAQLLNGLSYPLLMIAGVTYMHEVAPDGFRATAQGLFNMMLTGIGASIGGFLGGLLFDWVGLRWMYVIFALILMVLLAGVTGVRQLLPPEHIQPVPTTSAG